MGTDFDLVRETRDAVQIPALIDARHFDKKVKRYGRVILKATLGQAKRVQVARVCTIKHRFKSDFVGCSLRLFRIDFGDRTVARSLG